MLILIHFSQLYLNTLNTLKLSSNCPPTNQVAVGVNLAVARSPTGTDDRRRVYKCRKCRDLPTSPPTYIQSTHQRLYNHSTRNNELPLSHRRHRRPRRLEPEPQPARWHHTCRLQRPHKRHCAPLFRSGRPRRGCSYSSVPGRHTAAREGGIGEERAGRRGER